MVIGGDRVSASDGETFESVNPFSGRAWLRVPRASDDDVRRTVSVARAAFESRWRTTPGSTRAELLHRLSDLILKHAARFARMETSDNGKVIRETEAQMRYVARLYRYYAGWADKIHGDTVPVDSPGLVDYTLREPVGVVALITAWNSPMALLAYKLAPALAAGNTAIVKPSELAPATTLEFGRLVERAGFPPGVVNIISGGADTGACLSSAAGIDRISFTGGVAAGRSVAANAAQSLTPVTLELGGKSANIVFADADLDRAVIGALAGIFGAAGQTCIAGSRLLVQRPVYQELATRVAERADRIVLGDPLDAGTEMGPVVSAQRRTRISDMIASGLDEGAEMLAGGRDVQGDGIRDGFFVAPTVFGEVSNSMRIASEEIFGPVLCVIPFDDDDEAVKLANDSQFGLAGAVWTQDISRAYRVVSALDVGTMWVNTYRVMAVQGPFGGTKLSGYGRERGQAGLLEYTRLKNVITDLSTSVRDPFVIGTGA
jgi:(Z)-2-((N-methylformamido)methylene)-5-hydroxybutyrolactone dehydrogenase